MPIDPPGMTHPALEQQRVLDSRSGTGTSMSVSADSLVTAATITGSWSQLRKTVRGLPGPTRWRTTPPPTMPVRCGVRRGPCSTVRATCTRRRATASRLLPPEMIRATAPSNSRPVPGSSTSSNHPRGELTMRSTSTSARPGQCLLAPTCSCSASNAPPSCLLLRAWAVPITRRPSRRSPMSARRSARTV